MKIEQSKPTSDDGNDMTLLICIYAVAIVATLAIVGHWLNF